MLFSPLMYHCTKMVPYWENGEKNNPINTQEIICNHASKYFFFLISFFKICSCDGQREWMKGWRGRWSRWKRSCQSFMFVSDPQQEAFTGMEISPEKCMSECFNQSCSERKRQQLGQWLLVLNWILTGSTKQGSCRVTGGCAAMDVNTWADI